MTWILAPALAQLRRQADAAFPNRSRVSDGTIGDQDHSARRSDHNPDARGRVRGLDLTHDPAGGLNVATLADQIRETHAAGADWRAAYVIHAGRIASPQSSWAWRPYNGTNPHAHHLHVSVTERGADDSRLWPLPLLTNGDTDLPTPNDVWMAPVTSATGETHPAAEWLTVMADRISRMAEIVWTVPLTITLPDGTPYTVPASDLLAWTNVLVNGMTREE